MALGLEVFADLFRVEQVRFVLAWFQQRSMTGAGQVLYADRAPPLWTADVTTGPVPWTDAHAIMARLNSLSGGRGTVLLTNPRACYPKGDPGGAIFGAATPVVGTITDRVTAAFTGFPANYVVPAGTFVQIVFDTSRYYLGQYVNGATASSGGAIGATALTPALPDGVVSGNAVTVKRPAGKFRIVPGSAFPVEATGTGRARIQFSAEQTFDQG